MMVGTYAVTAILAAAGGKNRAQKQPMVPVAMGAKLLYDLMTTVKLGQEEWQENKALCIYCQAATAATIVSVALAVPEVIHALNELRGQPQPSQPSQQPGWQPITAQSTPQRQQEPVFD